MTHSLLSFQVMSEAIFLKTHLKSSVQAVAPATSTSCNRKCTSAPSSICKGREQCGLIKHSGTVLFCADTGLNVVSLASRLHSSCASHTCINSIIQRDTAQSCVLA